MVQLALDMSPMQLHHTLNPMIPLMTKMRKGCKRWEIKDQEKGSLEERPLAHERKFLTKDLDKYNLAVLEQITKRKDWMHFI